MGKAVLVIDMPKDCFDCPMCIESIVDRCKINYKDIHGDGGIEETDSRPSWCPLKPIEHRDGKTDGHSTCMKWFTIGWNKCIDAITGEE